MTELRLFDSQNRQAVEPFNLADIILHFPEKYNPFFFRSGIRLIFQFSVVLPCARKARISSASGSGSASPAEMTCAAASCA